MAALRASPRRLSTAVSANSRYCDHWDSGFFSLVSMLVTASVSSTSPRTMDAMRSRAVMGPWSRPSWEKHPAVGVVLRGGLEERAEIGVGAGRHRDERGCDRAHAGASSRRNGVGFDQKTRRNGDGLRVVEGPRRNGVTHRTRAIGELDRDVDVLVAHDVRERSEDGREPALERGDVVEALVRLLREALVEQHIEHGGRPGDERRDGNFRVGGEPRDELVEQRADGVHVALRRRFGARANLGREAVRRDGASGDERGGHPPGPRGARGCRRSAPWTARWRRGA